MNQKQTLLIGALLGALGVGFGAFGAHALKSLLVKNGRMETFELAVRYQFYHALALLFIGLLMNQYSSSMMNWSSLSIFVGVILFSGSLYLYSLTNITSFAMITPIGGLFLLGGWILLAYAIFAKG
jgi:uncharacterized membrane protein YgdD (TMEM256/DUF423 family)